MRDSFLLKRPFHQGNLDECVYIDFNTYFVVAHEQWRFQQKAVSVVTATLAEELRPRPVWRQ